MIEYFEQRLSQVSRLRMEMIAFCFDGSPLDMNDRLDWFNNEVPSYEHMLFIDFPIGRSIRGRYADQFRLERSKNSKDI
jgi:hypothetical protein